MGFWAVTLNALKNADLLLVLADARLPVESSNPSLLVRAKRLDLPVVVVFNKVDLLSKKQQVELSSRFPDAFLVSAKKKQGLRVLRNFLFSKAKGSSRVLRVAVAGYPNTGKSSLLNLLVPGLNADVSRVSGTTKKASYRTVDNLRFIDTPGVIPKSEREGLAVLLSAKNPEKIRVPERAAVLLLELLLKRYPFALKKTYGLEATEAYDALLALGKKKGYLQKGGEVNEQRASLLLIKDWQDGRIVLS